VNKAFGRSGAETLHQNDVLRYFPTQAFNFAFKDSIKKLFPRYSPDTQFMKFFAANMASGAAAAGACWAHT